MLTNEQINTFAELHKALGKKGFQYSFKFGSYGSEFASIVVHKESGSALSLTITLVEGNKEKERLEAYRKQLINLIEAAA